LFNEREIDIPKGCREEREGVGLLGLWAIRIEINKFCCCVLGLI